MTYQKSLIYHGLLRFFNRSVMSTVPLGTFIITRKSCGDIAFALLLYIIQIIYLTDNRSYCNEFIQKSIPNTLCIIHTNTSYHVPSSLLNNKATYTV